MNDRLACSVKENARERLKSSLADDLLQQLGASAEDFEWAPFSESEPVIEEFRKRYPIFETKFSGNDREGVGRWLKKLEAQIGECAILLYREDMDLGAVKMSLKKVLDRACELLTEKSESFSVFTPDSRNVLTIHLESDEDLSYFEVRVIGPMFAEGVKKMKRR